jgi:hypothetical protein
MSKYKFSGHETFQCRHFWIKKGYDFIISRGDFKSKEALVELGVGKNMVTSIFYWLKAFKIILGEGLTTDLGDKIFKENGFDPYLEDIGTQYILHFNLMQHSSFASVYKLAFEDFRRTRITSEFTEEQLFDFISKLLIKDGQAISEKSIRNDIKVFIKTYFSGSKRGSKSIEDDFASILIGLGFIDQIQGMLVDGQPLFVINYSEQKQLDELVFLYFILDTFKDQESIDVEAIQIEVSEKILCNREGTELKLNALVNEGLIVYKQDAGRKEIQLKGQQSKWEILEKYYGRV